MKKDDPDIYTAPPNGPVEGCVAWLPAQNSSFSHTNINTSLLAGGRFLSGAKVDIQEEEKKAVQPRQRLACSSKACWVGNHSYMVL